MESKFSLPYKEIWLAKCTFILRVGCVSAYFCGGHKNNLRLWFRSSFNFDHGIFIFHIFDSFLFLFLFFFAFMHRCNILYAFTMHKEIICSVMYQIFIKHII